MMLHFGIKKIERSLRIADKFYYPLSIEEKGNAIQPLFGASFGFSWKKHSICVGVRPSLERLQCIDVFVTVVFGGIALDELAGSIDTDRDYFMSLQFNRENTGYALKVYPKEKPIPCIHMLSHYMYPAWSWGAVRQWQPNNILLEK